MAMTHSADAEPDAEPEARVARRIASVAVAFTRCARPEFGRVSAYTVLGFAGYVVASGLAVALFVAWDLALADRIIGALVPPLAFLAVVALNRAILGQERIVFYQAAVAGVIGVAVVAVVAGARTARLVDIATIGIGTFLVLGRIGCFAVACCHGRPARFGVVYGPAHVRVGLSARWSGRTLWPTQLVESGASLALVISGLDVGWDEPGLPATVYIAGYAVMRFLLEFRRGDGARPQRLGVSEAQWTAPVTAIAVAIWRPGGVTIGIAVGLAVALAILVAVRRHRELTLPPHLHEVDRACEKALARRERLETSLGLAISCHALPDGRIDRVLSSTHPAWSVDVARRLAAALWPDDEIAPGRTPGIVHVIASGGAANRPTPVARASPD
jgi:hypothetical protein